MKKRNTFTRVHFVDPKFPDRVACGTRSVVVKFTSKKKSVTCGNCKHAGGIQ